MRIRAAFVTSLIILGLSIGCRNALSPNVDRNRAPETWITAAPLDTITIHMPSGIDPPHKGTVPYRFHMYWAGSDYDGAVVGYYWAVVETLPLPIEGSPDVPPLPGPRAGDYHYTTRTDSIFTFDVSEFRPDRQHAFFIYAVDDKGRADPTPARVFFNALDRYPPQIVFDQAEATGKLYRVSAHTANPYAGVASLTRVYPITDFNDPNAPVPRDSVPSNARIDFKWHTRPRIVGGQAVSYKYKLDEPTFIVVDSSANAVSYNTGINGDVLTPGLKVFTLRALDAAGGAESATKRFFLNIAPDTWFAGPDSNVVPVVSDAVNDRIDTGHRFINITNGWPSGSNPSSTPLVQGMGSLLSCDSLYYWPSERPQRKTFWEIYKNRLYLRAEGDTVDMNSIVCLQVGGADLDSRYDVPVKTNHPPKDTLYCSTEQARVLRPGAANGSPSTFQFQYAQVLDPPSFGLVAIPSQSAPFPTFDAASSFEQPNVNGYVTLSASGKVYMTIRAKDGDALRDERLQDMSQARLLAAAVDNGTDTNPYHRLLRDQLMISFYVNRAPFLNYNDPSFFPLPPLHPGDPITASPDRVLRLNLPAIDPDPFDPTNRPNAGGPSATTVLRWQVTVHGTDVNGRDTTFITPQFFLPHETIDLNSDAPYIKGTNLTLMVQLCDCVNCETQPGEGRCVSYGPIPVTVPSTVAATQTGAASPLNTTGTNLNASSGRSFKP